MPRSFSHCNCPSFWTSIGILRVAGAITFTNILHKSIGNLAEKRAKLQTQRLKRRLQNLGLAFYECRNTVGEFLNGVGHTIRLF